MTNDDKEVTIQKLLIAQQRLQSLVLIFNLREDEEKSSQVQGKLDELSEQIDILIVEAMQDWLADAKTVIEDISTANSNMRKAITNIRNDKKEADNFIKVIGFIDDILLIARSFLV